MAGMDEQVDHHIAPTENLAVFFRRLHDDTDRSGTPISVFVAYLVSILYLPIGNLHHAQQLIAGILQSMLGSPGDKDFFKWVKW